MSLFKPLPSRFADRTYVTHYELFARHDLGALAAVVMKMAERMESLERDIAFTRGAQNYAASGNGHPVPQQWNGNLPM
ncbi:hypothetical protein TWF506_005450 [Arthrobotrys conoides]|uniref:Uncharacterized protein n=1 Tax=Arthrobotrys conoides TaxID=74498 RepID=A0AAN8RW10_9PEZI